MTERVRKEVRAARPIARRWRGLAIAGIIAIVGALVLAALHRPAETESRYAVVEQTAQPAAPVADSLKTELIRCRALPSQVDDPGCRAAWETNRRRFFGESRATRVPGDPLPTYASIPTPGAALAAMER